MVWQNKGEEQAMSAGKKRFLRITAFAVYLLAAILLSWHYAQGHAVQCDYGGINADFLNYNMQRRVEAGQAPYADFACFFGLGPIVVNDIFLGAGSTYADCLFAAAFGSHLIFCACVLLLVWCVTESLVTGSLVSVLLPLTVHSGVLGSLGPVGRWLQRDFTGLMDPTNYMRGIRSSLPFLLVLLAVVGGWLWRQLTAQPVYWFEEVFTLRGTVLIAFVCGLFIPWSLEYGMAAVQAGILLLLVSQITSHKISWLKFIRNMAVMLTVNVLGVILGFAIVTKGQPAQAFQAIQDTASYQYFYLNYNRGRPALEAIGAATGLWAVVGFSCLLYAYSWFMLKKGRAHDGLVFITFISLTLVRSAFVRLLGGVGYTNPEPLESFLVLVAAAYLLKGVLYLTKRVHWGILNGCVWATFAIALFAGWQVSSFKPQPKGTYIPKLGGYTTQPKALVELPKIIGDEPVFSTYATGLEIVTDQFQPSGYDYIVHCQGKEVQRSYAAEFAAGNYKYAHTSALAMEDWVANQNWFFYRRLLPEYKQVYKTEYSWLWEKCESRAVNTHLGIRVEQLAPDRVRLVCSSNNPGDFVADVRIAYSARFTRYPDKIIALDRAAVAAETTCIRGGENIDLMLPPASEGEYIPVRMSGGSGQVILKTAYGNNMQLQVDSTQFISAMPLLDYEKPGQAVEAKAE